MGVLDDTVAIVTGTSRGVGVGIAHELLRAGATVVGCSRSPLDAIPGVDCEPGWAERSDQMVRDHGDYHAITDNFRSFVLPKDDPTGSMYFDALPLKRGGEPAEVGRTCVFLASGGADFINGTTIEIDGGMLPGVLYDAGLKTMTDLL